VDSSRILSLKIRHLYNHYTHCGVWTHPNGETASFSKIENMRMAHDRCAGGMRSTGAVKIQVEVVADAM
jgi:hypothetical protein